ncbi:MAG: hypothetical protein F6K31_36255 [Symploca sp. SIO2G7]|nr:hypothetical protein [Symploca sp. SIO2G7]
MANQDYIGASGTTLYRKATGTGTDGNPFVPEFKEPDIGSTSDSPATSDTGTFSLIALFKRSLQRWTTFLTDFGATADAESATGSLMARLRYIANNLGGSSEAISSELTTTTTASVGTSLTTVLDVNTENWHYLSIKIQNTGAEALTDFQTQGFYSSQTPFSYALLASAGTASSYGAGMAKQSNNTLIPVVDAFNLPAMGATSDGQLEINCTRYQRIRLQALVASGTTSITIDGILKR